MRRLLPQIGLIPQVEAVFAATQFARHLGSVLPLWITISTAWRRNSSLWIMCFLFASIGISLFI
jgi:hypothetical protein